MCLQCFRILQHLYIFTFLHFIISPCTFTITKRKTTPKKGRNIIPDILSLKTTRAFWCQNTFSFNIPTPFGAKLPGAFHIHSYTLIYIQCMFLRLCECIWVYVSVSVCMYIQLHLTTLNYPQIQSKTLKYTQNIHIQCMWMLWVYLSYLSVLSVCEFYECIGVYCIYLHTYTNTHIHSNTLRFTYTNTHIHWNTLTLTYTHIHSNTVTYTQIH